MPMISFEDAKKAIEENGEVTRYLDPSILKGFLAENVDPMKDAFEFFQTLDTFLTSTPEPRFINTRIEQRSKDFIKAQPPIVQSSPASFVIQTLFQYVYSNAVPKFLPDFSTSRDTKVIFSTQLEPNQYEQNGSLKAEHLAFTEDTVWHPIASTLFGKRELNYFELSVPKDDNFLIVLNKSGFVVDQFILLAGGKAFVAFDKIIPAPPKPEGEEEPTEAPTDAPVTP